MTFFRALMFGKLVILKRQQLITSVSCLGTYQRTLIGGTPHMAWNHHASNFGVTFYQPDHVDHVMVILGVGFHHKSTIILPHS